MPHGPPQGEGEGATGTWAGRLQATQATQAAPHATSDLSQVASVGTDGNYLHEITSSTAQGGGGSCKIGNL